MEDRLKNIMSIVFEIDIDAIEPNSSPDNIDNWDSIRHMLFISALEDEFGVRFTDNQIIDVQSYQLALLTLKECGVTA